MAQGGESRGSRSPRPARTGSGRKSTGRTNAGRTNPARKNAAPPRKPAPPTPAPTPAAPFAPSGRLSLGVVAGATPGRWIDTWRERHPDVPAELHPLDIADQRAGLDGGALDAALVRLPIPAEGLSIIPLYDERPVVVASAESHLTAADDLGLADLAGEVVIIPRDDVLRLGPIAGAVAPSFGSPETTEGAVEIVATGVGVVIVPMSLARLHHRRDVTMRVLRDGPDSTIALAWPAERATPAVEAFIGIVRGRTAQSSRS